MVYDQYARVRFPGRQLRRFVEVRAPEGDEEHAWEDYWRRWAALQSGASTYRYRSPIQRHSSPASPFFLEPPICFQLPPRTVDAGSLRPRRSTLRQFVEETSLRPGLLAAAPRRPLRSPGEQGALGATEVPHLQGTPSAGVSANEGPRSSAESSSQEADVKEPSAAPPAPGGGAENGS
ncbi:hypothetical protein Efla_001118 [Eimeria flavescens]